MPLSRKLQDRRPTGSLIAALGLHLALLGGLILLPNIERLSPAPEQEGIEVELVAPEQTAPTSEPRAEQLEPQPPPVTRPDAAPAEPLTPARPPAPVPPPVPAPPVMVRARRLLSENVLSNPHSRGTRAALQQLQEPERIEQLCNLEAMGQIHAWRAEFQPDRVVAYAMEGTKLQRTVLQADGAAFRSRQNWYRLKFRCELSADRGKVAGFEFMVGDPVPRSEWQARDLPAVH